MSLIVPSMIGSISAAVDYYPETGHYLYGQFRDCWNANGGVNRFGFPVTEVLGLTDYDDDSGTYLPIQFFQRAVFVGSWDEMTHGDIW